MYCRTLKKLTLTYARPSGMYLHVKFDGSVYKFHLPATFAPLFHAHIPKTAPEMCDGTHQATLS
jgi:hypothetical protein